MKKWLKRKNSTKSKSTVKDKKAELKTSSKRRIKRKTTSTTQGKESCKKSKDKEVYNKCRMIIQITVIALLRNGFVSILLTAEHCVMLDVLNIEY